MPVAVAVLLSLPSPRPALAMLPGPVAVAVLLSLPVPGVPVAVPA